MTQLAYQDGETSPRARQIEKQSVLEAIGREDASAYERYVQFYVGSTRLADFARYELLTSLLGPMPGAAGLLLRKVLYPSLFKRVGKGVVFGRNITLRHPEKIAIGAGTAIDNDCQIDARGAGDEGIRIGSDVIIASGNTILAKLGPIRLGNCVSLGNQCLLASVSGIYIGESVGIAGQCFIGGGRYHYDDRDVPIMEQGVYTKGPVRIDDDVWIGAGCRILDGVHIGKGSVIGAGAVIQEDIPPYTVAAPYSRLVKMPRGNEA